MKELWFYLLWVILTILSFTHSNIQSVDKTGYETVATAFHLLRIPITKVYTPHELDMLCK